MSKESKTLEEVMKADSVEKEKAEQELQALQVKLKAATEKMLLTSRRLTSGKTHQTGSPSGAQISRQDVSAFAIPKGTSEQRDETGGDDAKTDPESPADESDDTLQSAGISDGTVEGNAAVAVAEPAA